MKSDGTIWFTDPPYGLMTGYEGGRQEAELPSQVFRLDPGTGSLSVVADDFVGPNGLCFSPDESLLYIGETGDLFHPVAKFIRAFDVVDGERLANGRAFHTVAPGFADGFRADEHGNLWSSAGDGVHCIGPSGALLGVVRTGGTTSNLAFGGRGRSRMFICASHRLCAIFLNVRGAQRP